MLLAFKAAIAETYFLHYDIYIYIYVYVKMLCTTLNMSFTETFPYSYA